MNTTEHCNRLRSAAKALILGLALACSSVTMAQNAPAAAGFAAAGGAPAAVGSGGLGMGAPALSGGAPGAAVGAASGAAASAVAADGFETQAAPTVIGGEGLSPSQDAALDQAVTVDADGNDRVGGTVRAARVLNDFQQFVARSTGQVLPLYGSGFFAGSRVFNSPTAPVADDYVLGPGDQVLVRIWGAFESQTRAQIDR
ncbi:MAG TPA: polysaccharide biosynthesis/export family protein, partial [Thauera aminoaromatica]|nr:polysaccharide biosynthesis/export family protein [Thauera aminoaromatica]